MDGRIEIVHLLDERSSMRWRQDADRTLDRDSFNSLIRMNTTNPKTQQLIQQLANGIVSQVLGDKAMAEVIGEAPADPNNDEEQPLFEGRAALAVLLLAPLQQQVNPPAD
jgi:hypothetical protein